MPSATSTAAHSSVASLCSSSLPSTVALILVAGSASRIALSTRPWLTAHCVRPQAPAATSHIAGWRHR